MFSNFTSGKYSGKDGAEARSGQYPLFSTSPVILTSLPLLSSHGQHITQNCQPPNEMSPGVEIGL